MGYMEIIHNTNGELGERSMKHIIIDLEMNKISKTYREERFICGMETIQIGAIVLDDQYQEIGSFNTLVKPQYNDRIEPYYSKLTGITTEMVQNAPGFETAIRMFFSWCASMDEARIHQWSESDLDQVRKELALKQIQLEPEYLSLLEDWNDFQKEFGDELHISRSLSLKTAVDMAGLDFDGEAHNALNDARTTAALLRTVHTPALRQAALDRVVELMTPKTIGTSLGSLFNFSALGFSA